MHADNLQARGPPLLPFILTLGVTGHREGALDSGQWASVEEQMDQLLGQLEKCAAETLEAGRAWFEAGSPTFLLVTPLADGADQLSAELALARGWAIRPVLPFVAEEYRQTLSSNRSRKRFDRLLKQGHGPLVLPGQSNFPQDAYAMAGRATIAHCDLLLALWDGEPARGRGGTAEVVKQALAQGVAVIHFNPRAGAEPKLMWSAFDPAVLTRDDTPTITRVLDDTTLCEVLCAKLLPPPGTEESGFLATFLGERMPRWRWRIEYPALLAVAGIRRLSRRDLDERACAEEIRLGWDAFRKECAEPHGLDSRLGLLGRAYAWADQLAVHFAQTYRSGHVFAFVFGGIAVCIGLSAFMAPALKFEFAAAELAITFAVIANGLIGNRSQWHRRWLDYRQLADRLRHLRSLNLLAIAAPDPPGTATNPVPKRWIDTYVQGIWRAMGAPSGTYTAASAAVLGASIGDQEIGPQVAYHRRNAAQVERLDKRLEWVGMALFVATLLVSVATMFGMAMNARWVDVYGDWFTLVSAGFPALGTAVFGIRFQADFGGDAVRSLATAQTLGAIQGELQKGVPLTRSADLVEQASRVMLDDLDEWRLVNQQRDLSVG